MNKEFKAFGIDTSMNQIDKDLEKIHREIKKLNTIEFRLDKMSDTLYKEAKKIFEIYLKQGYLISEYKELPLLIQTLFVGEVEMILENENPFNFEYWWKYSQNDVLTNANEDYYPVTYPLRKYKEFLSEIANDLNRLRKFLKIK